jgi:hypothetical protein
MLGLGQEGNFYETRMGGYILFFMHDFANNGSSSTIFGYSQGS